MGVNYLVDRGISNNDQVYAKFKKLNPAGHKSIFKMHHKSQLNLSTKDTFWREKKS